MTETMAAWSAPECPFRIEYALNVLEDVRLAVTDAFFSLPRGGAEIGGILLGKPDRGRLTITGYAPLECEHAFGPSFVLSPNDHRRLSELLAAHRRGAGGIVAVGWYHSHTRSEIFLTDMDLEIHERYFPEPWQVALVVKPHAFQPMRAGFFFREATGKIRAESSYCEFKLDGSGGGKPARPNEEEAEAAPPRARSAKPDPLPPPPADNRAAARAMARKLLDGGPAFSPSFNPPPEPEPAPVAELADFEPSIFNSPVFQSPPTEPPPFEEPVFMPPALEPPAPRVEEPVRPDRWRRLQLATDPVPEPIRKPEPLRKAEPEPSVEPEEPPKQLKAPELLPPEPKRSRRWIIVTVALVGGLALGAAAYQFSDMWVPRATSLWRSNSAALTKTPYAGLQTFDADGQLQIRWDRSAPTVQSARDAILTIQDGGSPMAIQLDTEHLQTGSFTYGRQGERVDVTLVLHGQDGKVVLREASTYVGKLPDRSPAAENPDARRQREELTKQAETLSKDLKAQRARTQKLEKSLESMKSEVEKEQRRRLENQIPDK